MKNQDLRQLISEELEKHEVSLLTEKFGSKIISDIWKRMSGGRWGGDKDLFGALSNTYGIAWDRVQDSHVETGGANPRRGMLNIFYVSSGTANPYGEGHYDYDEKKRKESTFYRDMFLGATIGKKMVGVSSGWNRFSGNKGKKSVSTSMKGSDRFGDGQDEKIWNYKRLAEVSTEVYTMDLGRIHDWNKQIVSARADAKEGATALLSHKQSLEDNRRRYQDAINDIRNKEVQGKEELIIGDMVEKAEIALKDAMDKRIGDLRNNIVYTGWDTPFETAKRFYENMIRLYENMLRDVKAAEDAKAGVEKGDTYDYSKYYTDRVTEAAKEAKKELQKFERAMDNVKILKPVEVSESVLVNEIAPLVAIGARVAGQAAMSMAADKVASKVSESMQIDTDDVIEFVEACAENYHNDEDESHTDEGYMKEMYEKMYENWKAKIGKAVGQAATQAATDVASDAIKKKMSANESFEVILETDSFLVEGENNISKRFLLELENRNVTFEKVTEGCGCNGSNESVSCVSYKGTEMVLETMIKDLWADENVKESLLAIKFDSSKMNEEYVESMNSIELANLLGQMKNLWDEWKNGPMTEPSDIKPAQKELIGWISRWMKKEIK